VLKLLPAHTAIVPDDVQGMSAAAVMAFNIAAIASCAWSDGSWQLTRGDAAALDCPRRRLLNRSVCSDPARSSSRLITFFLPAQQPHCQPFSRWC
jgi:hypothetical protein